MAERLFPICRSLTGDGNRETLRILSEIYPVEKFEVPTGTKAFDWTVPDEWNIRGAYIEDASGKRIVDFAENNLHVVGYSEPVDTVLPLWELKEHLYSLPDQTGWIPYVTSYYKRSWGFCICHDLMERLPEGDYHVVIDSMLRPGSLTYGEILIPGKSEEEVFFSTYICHPSMANNEISGPCVAIYLAKWISSLSDRRYSYRIVFAPETLGALVYLSRHIDLLKQRVVAGFVLTCLGDDRAYSYVSSRYGNTLADRVALNLLRDASIPDFNRYSYLDRGSDERQYCAPGVDLPLCSVMRSRYGDYPEYHTSADNLDVISPEGLEGALHIYQKIILGLEGNHVYQNICTGEPQLGKRGLYPTTSFKGSADHVKGMMDFLAYADGENDLIAISDIIGVPLMELIKHTELLEKHGLVGKSQIDVIALNAI